MVAQFYAMENFFVGKAAQLSFKILFNVPVGLKGGLICVFRFFSVTKHKVKKLQLGRQRLVSENKLRLISQRLKV